MKGRFCRGLLGQKLRIFLSFLKRREEGGVNVERVEFLSKSMRVQMALNVWDALRP